MATVRDSKTQILTELNRILAEQYRPGSKVATKEEEAQLVKNKEIVSKAATYTVDTIVKGMADLQLEFGSIVNGLSETLKTEVEKLTEVKQSIEIETQHRSDLQQIRIVADALHIITQEHQQSLKAIEQQLTTDRENLEQEQTKLRKQWEQNDREYTEHQAELATIVAKERQKEQDEVQYKVIRDRQLQTDAYTETKRNQEQDIRSQDREKQKQWKEREKFLKDNQKLLDENLVKVTAFPAELEEAVKKAREEAIKETSSTEKVKADLVEKEWEGSKQGYEMKIQSLERVIDRQNAQITAITEQLQTVMNQAQSLAMKAFETSAKISEKN
jgi:DNA repair exonuclease SbcCD ATPase subunit